MKENLISEKSHPIEILEIMSDNLKAFKHSKLNQSCFSTIGFVQSV